MNYDRNYVICTLHALRPDLPETDDGSILLFDQTLFDRFHGEVTQQAADAGIAATSFNLSMLVFLSAVFREPTVRAQVAAGVRFFLSAHPIP